MKLSQLIECHMRNIYLEKSYTKCGGETKLETTCSFLILKRGLELVSLPNFLHDY